MQVYKVKEIQITKAKFLALRNLAFVTLKYYPSPNEHIFEI